MLIVAKGENARQDDRATSLTLRQIFGVMRSFHGNARAGGKMHDLVRNTAHQQATHIAEAAAP
jgi:hypothetical protein